jgi:glycerol-3-phosphate dehydrogenase (NAD(P)+)
VTEGVLTAAALVARAGEIELPICRAVADLLAGVKTLDQAITQLLSRPQRDE